MLRTRHDPLLTRDPASAVARSERAANVGEAVLVVAAAISALAWCIAWLT
ncbi:MAG TPA: hypothetical protein VGD56_20215 [Gemmatirosa sp.]